MENVIDAIEILIEEDKAEAEKYLIGYLSELDEAGSNDKKLLKMKSSDGETLIDLAISNKMQKFLCLVVEKYTNLAKIQNKYGFTFLHYAAEKGHPNVLNKALDVDPSLAKIQGYHNYTFLHLAAEKGHPNVLIKALETNLEFLILKTREGQTVLDLARETASKKDCKTNFSEFFELVDQMYQKEAQVSVQNTRDLLNERKAQKLGENRS